MRISPSIIRALPKADLHSHIDGSIPTRELFRISRRHRRKILTPSGKELETVSAFMSYIQGDGYDTMLEDIIDRFYPITRLLQTEETIRDAAISYVKGQKEEGVVYAEGRFAPQYHTGEGLSLDDVISSMAEGLSEGAERYGVKAGLIVAIGRESPSELGEEVARAASHSGAAVALDLGGPERGNPPQKFEGAFRLAAASGLKITIHAGEGAGSLAQDMENIEEAIALGANRIGHAIHLAGDQRLVSLVRERSIAIEVNPISNLVLRKITTLRDLAIDVLLKQDIQVSLNSDDPFLWQRGSLPEVYSRVCGEYRFGMEQVDMFVENSFKGAFVSCRDKEDFIQQYRDARRRQV